LCSKEEELELEKKICYESEEEVYADFDLR
jgi:hypothetical protein